MRSGRDHAGFGVAVLQRTVEINLAHEFAPGSQCVYDILVAQGLTVMLTLPRHGTGPGGQLATPIFNLLLSALACLLAVHLDFQVIRERLEMIVEYLSLVTNGVHGDPVNLPAQIGKSEAAIGVGDIQAKG